MDGPPNCDDPMNIAQMSTSFAAPHPAKLTMMLRAGVLALGPEDIGLSPKNCPPVWGLMMEMGFPRLVVTLVALVDGSVSVYLSDGGSVIGCGLELEVRNAAKQLLHAAQQFAGTGAPVQDHPMPSNGYTRFYLLTRAGIRMSEAPSAQLDNGESELAALYFAGHRLIQTVEDLSAGHDLVDEMNADKDNERQARRRGRGCRIPSYVGNAVRRSRS